MKTSSVTDPRLTDLGKAPLEPELDIRPAMLRWCKPPAQAFAAPNEVAARRWQSQARVTFLKCLGEEPASVPLRPRILEEKHFPGYTRTLLTLDTAPHLRALCWYCVPDGVTAAQPRPAMIAIPGHGAGAKDVIGMDAHGLPREEGKGYQRDFGLRAVQLGYPVLAIEPLGFGDRRSAEMMTGKSTESGCQALANVAFMLGTTPAMLRLHDIRRGIDFLQSRPEIDGQRLGIMGISGGGQMSLWSAAVEPRLKLVICSGYLNHFATSIMAIRHCICNVAPGLAQQLDMPDLAAMVAPRPILFESGTKDPIFPIRETRAAFAQVKRNYAVFKAADHIEHDVFNDGHRWSGRRVPKFLARWLPLATRPNSKL